MIWWLDDDLQSFSVVLSWRKHVCILSKQLYWSAKEFEMHFVTNMWLRDAQHNENKPQRNGINTNWQFSKSPQRCWGQYISLTTCIPLKKKVHCSMFINGSFSRLYHCKYKIIFLREKTHTHKDWPSCRSWDRIRTPSPYAHPQSRI